MERRLLHARVERCGFDATGALELQEDAIKTGFWKTVGSDISGATFSAGIFIPAIGATPESSAEAIIIEAIGADPDG
jgi:hypothetical protein